MIDIFGIHNRHFRSSNNMYLINQTISWNTTNSLHCKIILKNSSNMGKTR